MKKKFLAIGLAIGAAIGAATDNLALWLAIGVAIGMWLESSSAKREKQDHENLEMSFTAHFQIF